LLLGIATIGDLTRMYPALTNAAPFSRGWFLELNLIKNLRMQDYFSGYPEPGGMHAIVSLFSMLTQVSPEMILHLLGALSSFFLCIFIYWVAGDITKKKYSWAPLMGVSVYALVPMLFIPISLDQQIEVSSMDLALCFALPTFIISIRSLRREQPHYCFYVCSGFVATAMTNLFVTLALLLPLLLLGFVIVPTNYFSRTINKMAVYLGLVGILIAIPFLVGSLYYGVSFESFLLSQFFYIQSYNYYPLLIRPIETLRCRNFLYFAPKNVVIVNG